MKGIGSRFVDDRSKKGYQVVKYDVLGLNDVVFLEVGEEML